MIRDFDASAPVGTNRVAACITAQYNSERIIDEAAEVADRLNAEFHILHVNKGTSIFNNADTPMLLEKLFEYGNEKGGMVHMICSENVADTIGDFIEEYGITNIVLGEPPTAVKKAILKESVFGKIAEILKKHGTEIIIVRRPEEDKRVVNA
ncbi:hypothetical protein IMSAG049_00625 [Clostridiales bacterium]|nr:hypothetical protein IMSAG049_00625 [Clostridiales bacterium]